MEKLKVKVDWCEKNFGAVVDEHINGVVCVTAKSFRNLVEELKSSLEFHISECLKDGEELEEWIVSGVYELEYEYSASAMLQKAQDYTTLTAISKVTGIKHSQLSHYANAVSKPLPLQRSRIEKGIRIISEELVSVL